MYWYYKYPLLIICLLILFGIGVVIYKKLPENVTKTIQNANPLGDDGDGAGTTEKNAQQDGSDEGGRSKSRTDEGWGEPRDLVDKQLLAARDQLEAGKLLAARALAQNVLAASKVEMFDRRWRRAADILSQVNTKLINSDIPCPEKVRYEIQSGDNLQSIANKFNTRVAAIQRSNPMLNPNDPTIFPGTTLLIYEAEWRIEVYKENYVLLLMDGDKLFKLYPVAIGRQGRTPEGEFVIKNHLFHPDWTPPGRHIPYGDPENVLGTHWLGLRPTGETDSALSGYGIHGTWEPDSIGSAASLGCVRMRNEDVAEVFDLVPNKTNVVIKGDEHVNSP